MTAAITCKVGDEKTINVWAVIGVVFSVTIEGQLEENSRQTSPWMQLVQEHVKTLVIGTAGMQNVPLIRDR